MLFAALFLPRFSLQAVLRFRDDLRGKPVALVDDAASKGRVVEASGAARKWGVFEGMASTQAMARCAGLALLPRSIEQERVVEQILLEIAMSLSPGVERTAPGVCTVDLRGAQIPDRERWGADVVDRLGALHLEARLGMAGAPDLALLAARTAAPVLIVRDSLAFLAGRGVAEISSSPELLRILHDWGIRDLGGFARLPKSEVASRLGPEAVKIWEQAAGKSERLLKYVRPPELFEEVFEFEHEIETLEPLLFLLRRFIEQLSLRLQGAYRVASEMSLALPLENGESHARLFTIPSPTADVETLFRILHTHLDGRRLEHRPVALRLAMKAANPENRQLQIFENALRDPNRFGETLARLAALAGSDHVGTPQAGETHRPGSYRLLAPSFESDESTLLAEEPPERGIGLPLRRYRPPHPAKVALERSRPASVFSQPASGIVSGSFGPYRLSGEWWDAATWEAEEWDVELAGAGMYRLSRRGGEWTVEGCYD